MFVSRVLERLLSAHFMPFLLYITIFFLYVIMSEALSDLHATIQCMDSHHILTCVLYLNAKQQQI